MRNNRLALSPSWMTDSYREYVDSSRQLHALFLLNLEDSPEADTIREQMDVLWEALDEAQREIVRGIASDLRWIRRGNAGNKRTKEEAFAEDFPALLCAKNTDNWRDLLKYLRRCAPYLPSAKISYLRGKAWDMFGDYETAQLFFRHARKLAPEDDEFAYTELDRASRIHPERITTVLENDLQYLPAEVIKAVEFKRQYTLDEERKSESVRLTPILKRTILRMSALTEAEGSSSFFSMAWALLGCCYAEVDNLADAKRSFDEAIALKLNGDAPYAKTNVSMTVIPVATQPSWMTDSYRGYVDLSRQLHNLFRLDLEDSLQADAVREEMDALWDSLDDEQRETVRGLASDFRWLRRGSAPSKRAKEEALDEDLPALVRARRIDNPRDVLKYLRRCAPYLPTARTAYFRGKLWCSLGDDETALLFFEHARTLEPEDDEFALTELDCASRTRPDRITNVLKDDLGHLPLEVVKAVSVRLEHVVGEVRKPESVRLIPILERTILRMSAIADVGHSSALRSIPLALLGACYLDLDNITDAKRSFDEAIALSPSINEWITAKGWGLHMRDTAPAISEPHSTSRTLVHEIHEGSKALATLKETTSELVAEASSRITQTTAGLKNQRAEERLGNLVASNMDKLSVRLIPRDNNSRIRLRAAPAVYGSIYKLFAYSASVEGANGREFSSFFPRIQHIGTELASSLRLAPAEQRSFAFDIESIIPDTLLSGLLGGVEKAEQFRRRVMVRIIRGLHRCSIANDKRMWDDPFNEYKIGLNSNMCDALVNLYGQSGASSIEFGIQWSSSHSVPDDIAHINSVWCNDKTVEMAYQLSGVLRKDSPRGVDASGAIIGLRDKTADDDVDELSAQPELFAAQELTLLLGDGIESSKTYFNSERVVTMETNGNGLPRFIHFSLCEADYREACDAHKDKSKVRVHTSGILKFKTGKWILDPCEKFGIIKSYK